MNTTYTIHLDQKPIAKRKTRAATRRLVKRLEQRTSRRVEVTVGVRDSARNRIEAMLMSMERVRRVNTLPGVRYSELEWQEELRAIMSPRELAWVNHRLQAYIAHAAAIRDEDQTSF